MILKPLQKIQIVKSIKVCKAGSIGYLVSQDPVDDYNAWHVCIIFTRFGKGGKPRIEPMPINMFMIDHSIMSKADKDIIDIIKFYNGLEPRPYIHKGNQEAVIGTTLLEPIPTEHKNLLDLLDNEFMAYVIALSLLIYKLAHRTPSNVLHGSPKLKFATFDDNGFDLMTAIPEHIGYYIIHGLKYDRHLKRNNYNVDKNQLFSTSYARQTNNKAKKKFLLSKLHMALAMSKKAFERYNLITRNSFDNVSDRLTDITKYYRYNKKELDVIKKDEASRIAGRNYRYQHAVKIKMAGPLL